MSSLSRTALIGPVAVLAAWTCCEPAIDPHMDPGLLPGQCQACHVGHGESGSPMLEASQSEMCLSCHGSVSDRNQMIAQRKLSPTARPQLMSATLTQAFVHPITPGAYSREEAGVVTCTSCHSPHRGMLGRDPGGRRTQGDRPTGTRKLSPRNSLQFEYEMCEGCHAGDDAPRGSLEVGNLLDPRNRSYHPVEAPATSVSLSLRPEYAGGEVNCTDCHGNDDPRGIRGPHASGVRYILRNAYTVVDGDEESEATYALCYQCHDRNVILKSPVFSGHGRHISNYRASCATCHSAHGSLDNRALIRFGEERAFSGVGPSIQAGTLAFESEGPGSGACYVTCHGYDHAPEVYGAPSRIDPLRPGSHESKPGSKTDAR
jgi:predicted CXXCH cytochrome family protein